MKNFKLNAYVIYVVLVSAFIAFMSLHANAKVSSELESLGSNRSVVERANMLENRMRVGIVQGRAVDRNTRFELGVGYGPSVFGDPYISTQNLALRTDFHINPRWSLGLQYARNFNSLTNEGRSRFDQARSDLASKGDYSIPQITYPEESFLGLINWYLTYGKINMFDWRVVQFDIYAIAGYSQIKIAADQRDSTVSEWSPLWTAGGGLGFWLSQHLSTRFELRYQGYSDKVYTGERDINQMIATFGLGVLL